MRYTEEELKKDNDEFRAIWEHLSEVRAKKSADYGNSWSLFGLPGVICQIMSKAIRVWNLKNTEPTNESLRDSFRDLAVYSVMAMMLIDRGETEPKI